jgi:transcriptional regulator with XRE-family HTH domain
MSIDKIKQKLIQNSIKDSSWLEKAKWRQENEDWLDISFSIAVKVASTLSTNKKANVYPKSQVELAEAMGCSPQYVNKLLRGQEKLQIDTICKVQRILNIKLIEVPKAVITKTVQYQPIETWLGTLNIKSPATTTSTSYSNLKIVENYELAA